MALEKPRRTNTTDLRGEFDSVAKALGPSSSEPRKVLLVGQRGAGKTSFVQFLRKLETVADNKVATEKICRLHSANPVATQRADEIQISLGPGVAPLTVIDLPGWQDNDGTQHEGEEDRDHAKHIREAAASAEYLHCVVLVVNGTLARMQPSVDHSLRELAKIYPIKEIKDRVVVLFTFCDSLQRRAFPVAEDVGLLGEVGRKEQLCFYLDNPLGRLAGLDKDDLAAQLADEEDDTALEIRREVKKGAQSAVKLLKHVASTDLARPARATSQSSLLGSMRSALGGGSSAPPAAQTAGDAPRTKPPPLHWMLISCASALAVPFLSYVGLLCASGSHMIELPQDQLSDASRGCFGAALLYGITFAFSYKKMQESSVPQAREPHIVEMTDRSHENSPRI